MANPCPAIRITPPTVWGRASATARAPSASPRRIAGKKRSSNRPERRR